MDPIEFHKKLNFYSEADDPQDLATRIFGETQPDIVADSAVAVKVIKAVEQFLSDHSKQISLYDLPALHELQYNVERLSIWTKGALEKEDYKYLRTLEKTLTASLKLTKNNADLAINPDSEISLEDILSVADEYHSISELIKLCLIGKDVSSDLFMKAINGANESEVIEFINEVDHRRESDPHIFKDMINLFFQYATGKIQANFFSIIESEEFLTDIISALPTSMVSLNLSECRSLRDHHVENIENRLTLSRLEILCLNECSLLTNAAVSAIARSPYMINLQSLLFLNSPLINDEAALEIASSDNMANLQHLYFSICNLTDVGVEAIASSPHMAKLKTLYFTACNLTDVGVMTLATSPYMSSMQGLNFTACREITNAAVIAISNSAHMTNLRNLYLGRCDSLSDLAVMSIANSNILNQLEELDLRDCSELTDESATAISESSNLSNLNTLDFSGCEQLTDRAVRGLIESPHLPKLLNLRFYNCPLITEEALASVAKMRRERIIDLANE